MRATISTSTPIRKQSKLDAFFEILSLYVWIEFWFS
jgi:hypothetical protein